MSNAFYVGCKFSASNLSHFDMITCISTLYMYMYIHMYIHTYIYIYIYIYIYTPCKDVSILFMTSIIKYLECHQK